MKHYTKAYMQALLDKYMDGTTTLEEERRDNPYLEMALKS